MIKRDYYFNKLFIKMSNGLLKLLLVSKDVANHLCYFIDDENGILTLWLKDSF